MSSRLTLGEVTVVALALVMVCGIGCSGEEAPDAPSEMAQAKPAMSKPKPKPKPQTIEQQLAVEVDLPDFYPKDVPVYPGSKASMAGWQGGRISAVFSTEDSTDQVIKSMNERLATNGWEDLQEAKMPNGVVLQGFKKKGDRRISILVADLDKGKSDRITMIAISADPEG